MILEKKILELTQAIAYSEKIKKSISEVGVNWHIDHSLKVILKICDQLKKSDPKKYKWNFNPLRLYICSNGSLPRGKGKAPGSVVATGKIHLDGLNKQLEQGKKALKEIETLPPESYFKHQYFGGLNLKVSIKFLEVHTEHHLKIIRDIIE
ncbi:MAG: hypothetical protein JKY18_04140, partial [Flavobacteriales bacterium]|nr:hypothetical protein [Flavobacteriales bacterium]